MDTKLVLIVLLSLITNTVHGGTVERSQAVHDVFKKLCGTNDGVANMYFANDNSTLKDCHDVIITFQEVKGQPDAMQQLKDLKCEIVNEYKDKHTDISMVQVHIETTDVLDEIRRLPGVCFVLEAYTVEFSSIVSSTSLWAQDRTNQRTLPLDGDTDDIPICVMNICADILDTPQTVNIYILDTGINYSHDEFEGRAALELDQTNGDGSDSNGHGTHVAALVGGKTYGIAKTANLWSVKVAGTTTVPVFNIYFALSTLVNNVQQPAIVLLPWAFPGVDSFLASILTTFQTTLNVPVVVSAGNNDADASGFSPASMSDVLTVGATTMNDQRLASSNYGTVVDLFAPGEDVLSASHLSNGGSITMSGTSMAAAQVTGAVALLKEQNPLLTPAQLFSMITTYSTKDVLGGINASPNRLLYKCRL